MTKYCAGLPMTGRRALTSDEMTDIRQQVQGVQVMLLTSCAGLALGLVAWVFALLLLLPATSLVDLIFLWAICPLVLAVIVFLGHRLLRRSKALSQDLEHGKMAVFAGTISAIEATKLQKVLFRAHLLKADEGASMVQTIEALERAGWIFRVNGVRTLGWIRGAFDVRPDEDPLPPIPELEIAPAHIGSAMRSLSTSEKAELKDVAARSSFVVLFPLVATTLAVALVGLRVAANAEIPSGLWVLVGFAFLTNLSMLIYLPRLLRLRHDATEGRVQIMDMQAEAGHDVNVETLPLSGRIWTIEGHPAEWRQPRDKAVSR